MDKMRMRVLSNLGDAYNSYFISVRAYSPLTYRRLVNFDSPPPLPAKLSSFFFGDKGIGHSCGSKIIAGSCPRNCGTLSTVRGFAHGAALDPSLVRKEHGDNGEFAGMKKLSLKSASCYFPHPNKEKTGGEDAHFICAKRHVIGVADGVGSWEDVGVDAGEYARRLMSNSKLSVKQERMVPIDPTKVLKKAHSLTKVKGSSTACIVALSDKIIHAINLGDSGFLIIRNGKIVFRSPVQLHGFNHPYQLQRGTAGDSPGSGQVFKLPVVAGDVIVAGTDGLFDNLCSDTICSVVINGLRIESDPQVVAEQLAGEAREIAMDGHRQTPFSVSAKKAGTRHRGGKLDDITVVVSYITTASNWKQDAHAKTERTGKNEVVDVASTPTTAPSAEANKKTKSHIKERKKSPGIRTRPGSTMRR